MDSGPSKKEKGKNMIKKMLWAVAGLLFVISAAINLFIFVPLLLDQQVRFYESDVFINRLEFGIALFILLIALLVFGSLTWRAIKFKG